MAIFGTLSIQPFSSNMCRNLKSIVTAVHKSLLQLRSFRTYTAHLLLVQSTTHRTATLAFFVPISNFLTSGTPNANSFSPPLAIPVSGPHHMTCADTDGASGPPFFEWCGQLSLSLRDHAMGARILGELPFTVGKEILDEPPTHPGKKGLRCRSLSVCILRPEKSS